MSAVVSIVGDLVIRPASLPRTANAELPPFIVNAERIELLLVHVKYLELQ